jgi:SAM-dependent methyltransferase
MEMDRVFAQVLPRFRRTRMRSFVQRFTVTADSRILDVGGTPFNWSLIDVRPRVTMLNLRPPRVDVMPPNVTFVQGSALDLPFGDDSFDIAFSNSVIEHLGTLDNQRRFAREVRRVSRKVWVQTPNRWFPVEPHLLTPLIHYLPVSLQRRLLRNFTLWGWLRRPTQADVAGFIDEVRLLTRSEMEELFPDCDVRSERFLGMTKSFVAVRGARGPGRG